MGIRKRSFEGKEKPETAALALNTDGLQEISGLSTEPVMRQAGTDAQSGWGRGRIWIFVFLPVVLVAQAAPGQGDEHKSRHTRADQHR